MLHIADSVQDEDRFLHPSPFDPIVLLRGPGGPRTTTAFSFGVPRQRHPGMSTRADSNQARICFAPRPEGNHIVVEPRHGQQRMASIAMMLTRGSPAPASGTGAPVRFSRHSGCTGGLDRSRGKHRSRNG